MLRPRNPLTVLMLALSAVLVADTAASATLRQNTREGWMVGLTIGAGPGEAEAARAGIRSPSESGTVYAVRAGRMVTAAVLINLELEWWGRTQLARDSELTFRNVALAGTYYPWDPATPLGGLFGRAGLGAANVVQEDTIGGTPVAVDEDGWGLLLGAGYELRLTERLALGAGLSFNYLSIGGDAIASAQFVAMAFDLNWYL